MGWVSWAAIVLGASALIAVALLIVVSVDRDDDYDPFDGHWGGPGND